MFINRFNKYQVNFFNEGYINKIEIIKNYLIFTMKYF